MIPVWRGLALGLGVVLSATCHAGSASIAKNGLGAAQAHG